MSVSSPKCRVSVQLRVSVVISLCTKRTHSGPNMRAAALARPRTSRPHTAAGVGVADHLVACRLGLGRRSFSAGNATFTMKQLSPPSFQPDDNRKGVCVAGAGRMGQIRTRGIIANPGTFLCSIVDPDQQKAKALSTAMSVPAHW